MERSTAPVEKPSAVASTVMAECDELSALYAFLVEGAGVQYRGGLGGAAGEGSRVARGRANFANLPGRKRYV